LLLVLATAWKGGCQEVLLRVQAKTLDAIPRVVLLAATLVGAGEGRVADGKTTSRPDVLRESGPGLACFGHQSVADLIGQAHGDRPALEGQPDGIATGRSCRAGTTPLRRDATSLQDEHRKAQTHISGLLEQVQVLRAVQLDGGCS